MRAWLRLFRLELGVLLDAIAGLHSDHAIHGITPSPHRTVTGVGERD